MLDDEIVITNVDGVPHDKWTEVDAFRSGRRRITAFEVERSRVRVLDELGLSFVAVTITGSEAGAAFRSRERHTRTWRLGEEWTLVASHATRAKA